MWWTGETIDTWPPMQKMPPPSWSTSALGSTCTGQPAQHSYKWWSGTPINVVWGVPMNGTTYKKYLVYKVFPALDGLYGKNNYVWIQDGALAHICSTIQKYLKDKLFSRGFWSKDVWLLSSPNQHMEREASSTHHTSIKALEAAVEKARTNMSRSYVAKCCSFSCCCVIQANEAEGGSFQ